MARALDLAALVALALAIASSVTQPLLGWDSWAYHLPFSALLWDIGGAEKVFVLSPQMAARYAGFPLVPEWIQGALWKATGTINSTALIGSCSLALYVLVAARALRANAAILAFAALASPMIALHAQSAYVDLFAGVCLAFQVLAAVRLEALLRAADRRRFALWCAVYVAAAALAGNSKIIGPVLSVSITLFLVCYAFARQARAAGRTLLAVGALAAILCAATAIRNTAVHGNPLYPFDTTVAGVHLAGPEVEYRSYPQYADGLGILARPINWILSVTEADWLIRGVRPEYTIDSATGDQPRRYGPARTGGYGGALIIGSVVLAGWLASRAARSGALAEARFLLALFAYMTAVMAFMPQSHELRYYLYWPLLLFTVVAVLAREPAIGTRATVAIAAAYLTALLVSQQVIGSTLGVTPAIPQALKISYETTRAPVERIRARGATCLGPEFDGRQFAYSAVFHGGDYIVEQGLSECRRFPRFAGD